jgi:hypothetical protein
MKMDWSSLFILLDPALRQALMLYSLLSSAFIWEISAFCWLPCEVFGVCSWEVCTCGWESLYTVDRNSLQKKAVISCKIHTDIFANAFWTRKLHTWGTFEKVRVNPDVGIFFYFWNFVGMCAGLIICTYVWLCKSLMKFTGEWFSSYLNLSPSFFCFIIIWYL